MARVFIAAGVFIWGEEGASIVEYVLTLFLLVTVTMAAMSALGSSLSALFNAAASSI